MTLGGTVGTVDYLAGYLSKIRPQNADTFISMAQQAGATGSDDGVAVAGARLTPVPGVRIDVSEQNPENPLPYDPIKVPKTIGAH